MFELTEPQVWTLIGVFSGVMIGLLGIVFASFRHLGDGLRSELRTEVGSIRVELHSVKTEFVARMDSRFEGVNNRLDNIDRDVQFLMRKEFGEQ